MNILEEVRKTNPEIAAIRRARHTQEQVAINSADGAREGVRHRVPDLLPEYLRSRGHGAALNVAAGRFAFEDLE
jgi:SRSO17 transposase